jgi:hypothetical protein
MTACEFKDQNLISHIPLERQASSPPEYTTATSEASSEPMPMTGERHRLFVDSPADKNAFHSGGSIAPYLIAANSASNSSHPTPPQHPQYITVGNSNLLDLSPANQNAFHSSGSSVPFLIAANSASNSPYPAPPGYMENQPRAIPQQAPLPPNPISADVLRTEEMGVESHSKKKDGKSIKSLFTVKWILVGLAVLIIIIIVITVTAVVVTSRREVISTPASDLARGPVLTQGPISSTQGPVSTQAPPSGPLPPPLFENHMNLVKNPYFSDHAARVCNISEPACFDSRNIGISPWYLTSGPFYELDFTLWKNYNNALVSMDLSSDTPYSIGQDISTIYGLPYIVTYLININYRCNDGPKLGFIRASGAPQSNFRLANATWTTFNYNFIAASSVTVLEIGATGTSDCGPVLGCEETCFLASCTYLIDPCIVQSCEYGARNYL